MKVRQSSADFMPVRQSVRQLGRISVRDRRRRRSKSYVRRMKQAAAAWKWFTRNHSGVREWLVLLAAVVAVFFGYQQIADERDTRKASEARLARVESRDQAEKISAWMLGNTEAGMPAILANRSDQPVYEVIAYRVAVFGAAAHTGKELGEQFGEFRTFSILPPGTQKTSFAYGWNAPGLRPGIEIAFRDQAGIDWVRKGDGLLKRIDSRPVDYYDLSESQEWATP